MTILIKQKFLKILFIVLSLLFVFLLFFEVKFFIQNDYKYNPNYFDNFEVVDTGEQHICHEIGLLNGKHIERKMCDENMSIKNDSIIYDVNYTVRKTNIRNVKCNNSSDETYIFLGCAYVFGMALNDDYTLPYYFSQLYNFEKNIINCGIPGKSTNTASNILHSDFLNQYIRNSKVKHFFYSLVPDDHIERNTRFDDPTDVKIYRNKKWSFTKHPYMITKLLFIRSCIFKEVFLPTIDKNNKEFSKEYMIKSLVEMNNIVKNKYNSNLTVVVFPSIHFKSFVEKLKSVKNLDLIFLPEYFYSEEKGYRIKYDGHPTAKANKELAQILYNHINKSKEK